MNSIRDGVSPIADLAGTPQPGLPTPRIVFAGRLHADKDRLRAAREAAYHFMSAIAGDLPNFEEASRALFAGDRQRLEVLTAHWPADIRDHVLRLAFAGR